MKIWPAHHDPSPSISNPPHIQTMTVCTEQQCCHVVFASLQRTGFGNKRGCATLRPGLSRLEAGKVRSHLDVNNSAMNNNAVKFLNDEHFLAALLELGVASCKLVMRF